MKQRVGSTDIAMIVLDTLRYDVAVAEFDAGRTPNLAKLFPNGWEQRHSPGNFTYAAHHAFFAGFLPTPVDPNAPRDRLFATAFEGSETTSSETMTFDTSTIIEGLQKEGYHTICIGGVGFFNQQTALSRVLPDLFDEAHWATETGVTNPDSTNCQIQIAKRALAEVPNHQRVFFYLNVSAIHQPNCHYIADKTEDDLASHAAALRYVDSCIPELINLFKTRHETFLITCSDHGTLYGEEGFTGHRVGHEAVYTVPYADTLLSSNQL